VKFYSVRHNNDLAMIRFCRPASGICGIVWSDLLRGFLLLDGNQLSIHGPLSVSDNRHYSVYSGGCDNGGDYEQPYTRSASSVVKRPSWVKKLRPTENRPCAWTKRGAF
jgi:hypothetical protein